MERAKGFEPSRDLEQGTEGQEANLLHDLMRSGIGSHLSDSDRRDLARVVASWFELHPAVKSAILAIVSSVES